MGVYCDGEYTNYWKNLLPKDTVPADNKGKQILLDHINIIYSKYNITKAKDIIFKYWDEGIHYWLPSDRLLTEIEKKNEKLFLENLIHPFNNIYIAGEMISRNQGWVEGAIESVENLLKTIN